MTTTNQEALSLFCDLGIGAHSAQIFDLMKVAENIADDQAIALHDLFVACCADEVRLASMPLVVEVARAFVGFVGSLTREGLARFGPAMPTAAAGKVLEALDALLADGEAWAEVKAVLDEAMRAELAADAATRAAAKAA